MKKRVPSAYTIGDPWFWHRKTVDFPKKRVSIALPMTSTVSLYCVDHKSLNKDWIKYLSFWNEFNCSNIAEQIRYIEIPLVLFPLMIVGLLWVFSTRRNNPTAIINKEASEYNFFGSHFGRQSGSQSNGFNQFSPRNKRMLDSVFILESVV